MGSYIGISTIFVLCLVAFSANAHEVFNINSPPGSDITQELLKAFTAACQCTTPSRVVIPKGEFKLCEIIMTGPCKAPIEINLLGTLLADGSNIHGKDKWVVFRKINGFKLNGAGTFDGEGSAAWRVNNCHKTSNCKKLPISLRFDFVTNAEIRDISSVDSKNFHVNVIGAMNMTFDNVKILAPAESPNTDGIHLGRSDGVSIINSRISTGDDCTVQETDNGLRIKTWPTAACSTVASGIHFEDIILKNVSNPILIDQEYCPWNQCNKQKSSSIKLVDVSFTNIRGTSANKDAVKLLCSKGYPCENVVVGNINIEYTGRDGPATFMCSNVKPKLVGVQNPKACNTPPVLTQPK
ncbi:PREDICTED: polygalacturonase-like [Camelina sativa]|uniref:Polygalacturonase-like n=1 Tax=Camelina sativa TaxID=90675 RepID=A0ABM0XR91_CAMSA|nr:PREDICTED: polygalacturonase-like [Camelina sativa]